MNIEAFIETPPSVVGMDNIKCIWDEARETPREGCFVEVGVYHGGTAWFIAKLAKEQGREVYLYDTFKGIPYAGPLDSHKVGDFNEASEAAVRKAIPYATVVAGIFPGSCVKMPPVAFAHIDTDQYQSIFDACRKLGPMMLPGGKIIFDDVWCLPGATLALQSTHWPISKTKEGKAMVRF